MPGSASLAAPPRAAAAAADTPSAAGVRGLVCGAAFGAASPLCAHPLDTIKTRMQAAPACARGGALAALRQTVAEGGARALWRGLLPPLVGSVVFRASQMASFAYAHRALRDERWARARVPGAGALEVRVLAAAAVATTGRALLEAPLEALKVRAQIGAPPPRGLREAYTGFGLTWARLFVALGTFFVVCDAVERDAPALFATPVLGPFAKGAGAGTLGWALAWPLEVLKSRVQGGVSAGARAALADVLRAHGAAGLYRGLAPGLARSIVGNGAALAAYEGCVACFAV